MTTQSLALLCLMTGCACHGAASPEADGGTTISCANNHGGCDPNAACIETGGVLACICMPWMQGNGLACAATGLQQGSPWPAEGGNVRHTGQSPFLGANTKDRVRRFRLGPPYSLHLSSVVIDSNGTIYAASGDGALLALDSDTSFSDGTPKWAYRPAESAVAAWATPAVGKDGLLYSPYTLGYKTGLYALDATATDDASRVRWFYETQDIGGSAPVISEDGTLFVGSYHLDSTLPLSYGAIYAFGLTANPQAPQPMWLDTSPRPNGLAPTIGGDGTIFVGGEDGLLYAFTEKGKRKWRYASGGITFCSPLVAEDGTIYLANAKPGGTGNRGELLALDPGAAGDETRLLWSLQVAAPLRSIALAANGTIYIGSTDGKLTAVNPATADKQASVKWAFKAGASINSLAIGGDGLVYAGSEDYKVYAIRPDGTEQWSYATGYAVLALAIGKDGTLFASSNDGYLYAFGP